MPLIFGHTYSGIVHLGPWRPLLRLTATTLILLACAALLAACGDGDASPSDGVSVSTVTQGRETPAATAEPTLTSEQVLTRFIFPLEGACLPTLTTLMPNASRSYRKGIHEGVDLYAVDNCTRITLGTPVRAMKAGRVVRVDSNYRDPTAQEMNALLANPTTEPSIDAFRGRQVWIDHGGGVVTRYCHLSAVASGLTAGQNVNQGDVIAYVGESGTPESVTNPGTQYHLHFEVRVGSSYLGAGESPERVRQLYTALFTP